MITRNIHCTVYLEGLNVEFNSVQIQEADGSCPHAIVSFPADSAALTILPKTVCHVFYTDDTGSEVLIFQGELTGNSIVFMSDKRMINLTFAGITDNWETNFVIPQDDKPTTFMNRGVYAQITSDGNKTPTDQISFLNFKFTSPMDPLLEELVGNSNPKIGPIVAPEPLPVVLRNVTRAFGTNYPGIYWKMSSRAFGFDDMVIIDHYTPGYLQIQTLLQNVSAISHAKGLVNGVGGEQPISMLINTILHAFGYCYSEIAAPANTAGLSRGHVFIKPETHFFPPMMHNVVFDSDITQMNFQRNFDQEPSRLLSRANTTFVSQNATITPVLFSVLVPSNVRAGQGVNSVISTPADYKNLQLFGLSTEEQCRGVVLGQYVDKTLIEDMYLVANFNDEVGGASNANDTQKGGADGADNRNKAGTALPANHATPKTGGELSAVEKYHANIGSIMFYDQRHASRTVTVAAPFSPYRMVGFPGVIISRYLPEQTPGLVGNLAGANTTISADGDATQSLTFTHCRLINDATVQNNSPSLGFLDDATTQPIPWYQGYTGVNNINAFYEQFTGRSDSAAIDKRSSTSSMVLNRVLQLRDEINKPGTDIQSYILKITKRPLITRDIIDVLYPANKTRTLQSKVVLSYSTTQPIYVTDRQERVRKSGFVIIPEVP